MFSPFRSPALRARRPSGPSPRHAVVPDWLARVATTPIEPVAAAPSLPSAATEPAPESAPAPALPACAPHFQGVGGGYL